jgi:hypothetical protein
MNDERPGEFLERLFSPFRTSIDEVYAGARDEVEADTGTALGHIPLSLAAISYGVPRQHRSEFVAISPPPSVRVTWNGLASLWCFCQGALRIVRPMYEAQRRRGASDDPICLPVEGEIEVGLDLLALGIRLAENRFDQWVDWAPEPIEDTESYPDGAGNRLFLSALGWILRHELAHHAHDHHSALEVPEESKRIELEADATATRVTLGARASDPERELGIAPGDEEKELEHRALAVMIGLMWVAQFELKPHGASVDHPDASRRIEQALRDLPVREDSFALEVLSYVAKVMVDPQGEWPPDGQAPTSLDGAIQAFIHLSRHIASLRG